MSRDPHDIQDLFLRLVELSAADRSALLEQECGTDMRLRQRMEALLKAHEESDSLLDRAGDRLGATLLSGADEMAIDKASHQVDEENQVETDCVGAGDSPAMAITDIREGIQTGLVIGGRYTLVQRIGEGGMGDVWVAKQSEPIKRRVALKLIKTGMDTKAVLARFEQERQALAMMDHPNIARVLDGGATSTGQPFFVMELVNGLPLNKFCDEARLTTNQRLELFVSICQAVQHAHHKGIVHRDLKPANILVTVIDGRPVPKVIDFGVAKATSGKLTDESLSTQFGAVVGTLEYMSPEQAAYSGEDIDTRADIYSLGVILYELMTGLRPIDAKRLKKAALTEMIRIIREEEPSKPSTRLSTDESLPTMAALRQTEPRKLMALLRGELDWVILKCLEKQRDRRYDTANDLCHDIQRYLAGEPVEARPPSALYRFRKFVSRHRVSVLASAGVLMALVAGLSVAVWQSIVASDAEARALAALEDSMQAESLASSLAKDEARARKFAEQLVESEAKARKQAEDNFLRARRVVDDYLARVADDVRLQQGFSPLRKELLEDARRYYLEFLNERGDDQILSEEITHASIQIALLTSMIGSKREAIDAYLKVIKSMESALENKNADDSIHTKLATCSFNLASTYLELDEYEQAGIWFERSLSFWRDLYNSNPSNADAALELTECQLALAHLMSTQYQPDKAQTQLEPAIRMMRGLIEKEPHDPRFQSKLGAQLNELANIHMLSGGTDDATKALREARQYQRKAAELDPNNATYVEFLANHSFNLGIMLGQSGQREAAIEAVLTARSDYERLVRIDPSVSVWQSSLARSLIELSDLHEEDASATERLRYLQQAEAILENQMAINPAWNNGLALLAQIRNSLAMVQFHEGQYEASLTAWQLASQASRKLVTDDPLNERSHSTNLARTMRYIGNTLAELDRHENAIEAFSESEARFRRLLAENPGNVEFTTNLAQCLQSQGLSFLDQSQFGPAENKFEQCEQLLELLIQTFPEDQAYAVVRGGILCNRANSAAAQDDVERAVSLYNRAITAMNDVLQNQPGNSEASQYLFNSHLGRSEVLIDAGKYAEAITACSEAVSQLDPQSASSFQLRKAWCLARSGDHAAAVTEVETLIGRVNFDDAAMLNVAEIFCICAEQLQADNADLSQKYELRSLEWLQKSLASGEIEGAGVKQNADLKFLWDNPEFKMLVEQ